MPRATHKSAVITAALKDNVHECVLDKNEESEKSCSWKYILWLVCNCCASQHKLRSTERKSSTRFTQTFGRVHRTKAGEGPYGSSGISSLDRYYHRSIGVAYHKREDQEPRLRNYTIVWAASSACRTSYTGISAWAKFKVQICKGSLER